MKSLTLRLIRLIFGLFVMASGIYMAYQSNMGLAPWDVLNDGVAKTLHITMGQANMGLGLVILLLVLLFRERVGFGTFINIFLVGSFYDLLTRLNLIPGYGDCVGYESLLPRLALCIGSMIPISLGMCLYMSAALGAGPRDSLMCLLTKRGKLSVGGVRVIIEGIAFGLGWYLGGTIGLGSIALVLCSGPVMEGIFRLFRFDVKRVKNQTIGETLGSIKKALAPGTVCNPGREQ